MDLHSPTMLVALKLLTAMLCGGAIGFERELSRKPAGLRTNVLICMGAALYMIVSRQIGGSAPGGDPGRLAAQVVTGIGFLGAGVILQARGSVHGLTTAATIFVDGAVGVSAGDGMFAIAGLSTTLIIVVLVLLRPVERAVLHRRRLFHYSLQTKDPALLLERLLDLLAAEHLQLDDFNVKNMPGGEHHVHLSVITSLDGNRRLRQILPQLGEKLESSAVEHED